MNRKLRLLIFFIFKKITLILIKITKMKHNLTAQHSTAQQFNFLELKQSGLNKHLMLLLISFFSFFAHKKVRAQSCIINGDFFACVGNTSTYSINNPNPNFSYTWNVSNSNAVIQPNAIPNTGSSSNIYYANAGTYKVQAVATNGTTTINCSKLITVLEAPQPFITPLNFGNCSNLNQETTPCYSVCQNTLVDYFPNLANTNAYNALPNNIQIVNEWMVVGGIFTNNNNAQYIGNTPKVLWDNNLGFGSLVLVTKIIQGNKEFCSSTVSVCVEKVATPIASFTTSVDPLSPLICLGETVYFNDNSTPATLGTTNSNIVNWHWDFGDGTFSNLQTPSHQYNIAGSFIVKLTVTNGCGCSHSQKTQIDVSSKAGPIIFCEAPGCEGQFQKFSTNQICAPYMWSCDLCDIYVDGINYGQTYTGVSPDIYVDWPQTNLLQSSNPGFENITLNGGTCNGLSCNNITTMQVPVIHNYYEFINACNNTELILVAPEWPATDFTWILENTINATPTILTPTYNDKTVTINTGPTNGVVYIQVDAKNTLTGCVKRISYRIIIADKPSISGVPSKICVGMNLTPILTTSPTFTLTGGINWIINGNNQTYTFNSSFGTNTISISSLGLLPGVYTLKAESDIVGAQEFCPTDNHYFEVIPKPAMPTSIAGKINVCPNVVYKYSTTPALTGFQYLWSATPNGMATSSLPANGDNVYVMWNSGILNKTISVQHELTALPGCISDPFSLALSDANPNAFIIFASSTNTQNVQDCSTDYKLEFTDPTTIADNIFWYLNSSSYGDILIGQGTTNVKIGWNQFTSSSMPQIKCNYSVCGQTYTTSINAPVLKAPKLLSVNNLTTPGNPSTFCSGDNQIFNLVCNVNFVAPGAFVVDWGDNTVPSTYTVSPNTFTTSASHTYINNTNTIIQRTIQVKVASACNPNVFDIITQVVDVKPQPNSNLTYQGVNTPCPNTPINVICNLSSNVISSFDWRFQPTGSTLPPPYNPIPGTSNTQTSYTVGASTYGNYYVNVTYNGCSKLVGPVSINTVSCGGLNIPCPVLTPGQIPPPSPITTFNSTLLGCNQAFVSVNSNTPISNGLWTVSANSGATIITPASATTSPVYNFPHAGVFNIGFSGDYQVLGQLCPFTTSAIVTIPLSPSFKYGVVCNPTNNGYILKLEDLSSVAPAYANSPANAIEWRLNGVLQTNTGSGTIQTYTVTPNTSYTIELTRKVGSGLGEICTTSQIVTIPSLPNASFTVVSTNPLSTANAISTCEFKPLNFTNTSTPAASLISYNWQFGVFGNNTKDVSKVLEVPSTSNVNTTIPLTLTVTDIYGCKASTASSSITIENNLYKTSSSLPIPDWGNGQKYIVSSQGACPPILNLVAVNGAIYGANTPGNPPFTYKWYDYSLNNLLLASGTSSTLNNITYSTGNPGSYFVNFIDKLGCEVNWNTPTANITTQSLPPVYITGKPNICSPLEPVMLNCNVGATSNGITVAGYTWSVLPASSNTNLGNASSIIEYVNTNGLIQTFTYICKVDFLVNGNTCSKTVAYNVTAYPNPAPPIVNVSLNTCQPYTAIVSATQPFGSPAIQNYNYNAGIVMPAGVINTPGTYTCVAVTAQGCTNYSEFTTPKTPDTYLWRMPKGCMEFCESELPKFINPPYQVSFDDWAWYKNSNPLPWPNGSAGWADHGNGFCDPLWIHQEPGIGSSGDGNGSGPYAWVLTKDGCTALSPDWNVAINTNCCNLQLDSVQTFCDGIFSIILTITPNIATSNTFIPFTVAIVDDLGNPIGPVSTHTIFGQPFVSNLLTNNSLNYVLVQLGFFNPTQYTGNYHLIVKALSDAGTCIGKYSGFMQCPIIPDGRLQSTIINDASSIQIFPNPTSGILKISLSEKLLKSGKSYNCVIKSPLGQIVIAQPVSSLLTSLDVKGLPSGLYFCEVWDELNNKIKITKIQINN
jgi:hypothetical protein